ncbi:MAG: exodeoxyribonuclease VII small subunit [Atopobiaceae bacterium]|nr:exodeoxyribonuclease VII small subunit [Atopobiaceae bacterium]MBR3315443.1 exodeoxyribonuclease VII small subunit [Atopobiaceae bacterium]
MARRNRVDTSTYKTFGDISARLDEIVTEVRRRDIPLESSLDLFEEAIALGQKAVDFVDTDAVTGEEALRAEQESVRSAEDEAAKGGA